MERIFRDDLRIELALEALNMKTSVDSTSICLTSPHELIASKSVGWIASAEAKATAGLTVEAVLIGLVMMDGKHDPTHQLVTLLFWCFIASAALAAGCCLFVLWPRTNRLRLLGVKGKTSLSPTFFEDVTAQSFENFKFATFSDMDIKQDAIEQAYILAKIARLKMWWVKVSFLCVGASVLLLAALSLAKFHS